VRWGTVYGARLTSWVSHSCPCMKPCQQGALRHGIPRNFSDLPDVVAFFRTLLKDHKFEWKDGQKEDEAVRNCHSHGWIHATAMPVCVTRFPLLSMKCVFPGRSSLQTICPISIPSSSYLSRPSPSSSRLSYAATLPLNPRTHPKYNTKTNSMIRYCLSLSGIFVSPLSMHLQRGCVRQAVSTSSFQSWNGVSRSLKKGTACYNM